ncbi:bifunctional adenosylcobinamide kinase/adenosylcobinamide-phosphate guanylyltransferase [Ruegeria sp. 2012CJ41-6]|uniref:Bifunctional adenosylcobalamin biosynthesis protein n=1 Tax=Ruegeria spongiae TaxID=2942209 RepID=A0ABT0Q1X3_9RHOB|nr:bifunctional adenosylcobinamide kinase/adenosylcobinamide-phosphate guanylyltransferase [Ruegeria spongiae]MCL6282934.1 bifunctional adenosylcobinamide kinase/adenosylcobinamide-phosphate guanylyltransferase [Ruegeria spongiae]
MFPKYSLILGGAASGKSFFAEQLSVNYDKNRYYIATSQVFDDEMRAKIDRHVIQRGAGWTTIEAPFDLAPALDGRAGDEICLIDCATMWLSNHLLAENDLAEAQAQLLSALRNCQADVVIVSNEVGHGIVPDNALARQFREAQGRLNIALASEAELVVQVVAGLPQVLKGTLP